MTKWAGFQIYNVLQGWKKVTQNIQFMSRNTKFKVIFQFK